MKHFLAIGMVLFVFSVMPAQAQTDTDANEGVRVAVDATTGAYVLTWWGKAGRTYFVQQSYDLVTWTYLVVRGGGAAALDGLNIVSTDERQFWRLKYTDASISGYTAATADFDGDGLTNQQELNLGIDPFKADTDDDGWNDSLENTIGSSAVDAGSTPPDIDPGFITWIRSYDLEEMQAWESYWMDWLSMYRLPGEHWQWSQSWHLPNGNSSASGKSDDKPTITSHDFPFDALGSPPGWFSSGELSYQGITLPQYTSGNLYGPFAYRQPVDSFDGSTYRNESSGWECAWYRYRLHLSETLPFDYSENFLAITYEYEPNPDYGLGGTYADYLWKRTGIREVLPMKLEILAGDRTGAWKFQAPAVEEDGKFVAVQVVPVTMVVKAEVTDQIVAAPENGRHDQFQVANDGSDFLGPQPMGRGRPDTANAAYTGSCQVIATVKQISGASWRWRRFYKQRKWGIHKNVNQNRWDVFMIGESPEFPTLQNDIPSIDYSFYDDTPSDASGKIYCFDNSAVVLATWGSIPVEGAGHFANSDAIYCEKQFLYQVEFQFNGGDWQVAGELPVGQIIRTTRIAQTGDVALDWSGDENSNLTRTLDVMISENEVRRLVGGSLPIQIPTSANGN